MADVVTRTRTNYFKTTDPDALKALLDRTRTDGEPVVLVERQGEYMFYCAADIMGILTEEAEKRLEEDPDWADDNPEEAWSVDLFLAALSRLVAPGDACAVKSVWHEAMRSVSAGAYLVTHGRAEYVGFDDVLRGKARAMLGDPGWKTLFEG